MALLRFVRRLLIAVALLWLAAVALVLIAGRWAQLRPTDAILVLGAAQYNGRPSPVLKARLDHALDLHRRGYARYLILTGGVGQGDTLSEGEVSRRYVRDAGVPDSVILVERQGVTSAQSMGAAAALMRANGLRSALIVSDSYHMMRLDVLARRAGIRPYRAPTPGAPIDRTRSTWWQYVLRESVLFPATALLGGR